MSSLHRPLPLRRVGEEGTVLPTAWQLLERSLRRAAILLLRRAVAASAWFVLLAPLALVALSPFCRPRCCIGGQLTACKSNLKNMATALEMYASDYAGEYPTSWAQMTAGHYLKSVPTCPAANLMTYSYRRTGTGKQAGFYLQCCGSHHAKAYSAFPNSPHNFPRYSSETGLGYHP